MKDSRNRQGFTIVEVVIAVVIVAILVVGGWFVYDRNVNKDNSNSKAATSTEVMSEQEVSDEVSEVKTIIDLKKLDAQLNDTSLGDGSASDLADQLDF